MNGSGCKNCPVEKCETLNYRGSVCAVQRAKLGLGDPNDRLDCRNFQDCSYRNDVGWCPENCVQYRHKDDVRVVRCEKCEYWHESRDESFGWCTQRVSDIAYVSYLDRRAPDDFCSKGEPRCE